MFKVLFVDRFVYKTLSSDLFDLSEIPAKYCPYVVLMHCKIKSFISYDYMKLFYFYLSLSQQMYSYLSDLFSMSLKSERLLFRSSLYFIKSPKLKNIS